MPYDAGSVVASIRWEENPAQAHVYEQRRRTLDLQSRRDIVQRLRFDVDERSLNKLTDGASKADISVAALGKTMRSLFDTAGKITVLGIAAQALSALGAAGGAAAAGLAPVAGALAAYPALASAAGQGLGVFHLATDGVFKAVGGLNNELDRNSRAFKTLTPEGQRFAVQLERMKAPLRDLSSISQRGLFPGMQRGLQAAERNLGVIRPLVRDTARELGNLAQRAGELVGSRAFGRDLQTQGERNVRWLDRGGTVALSLADALRHVTLAAGPLVDWLTRGTVRLSELIDREAEAGRQSGALAGFFEQTRIQMSRVARIAADVGAAFLNIGKAAYPLGNEVLRAITRNAEAFKDWTASAQGQNVIRDYFEKARPAIFALGRLLEDVTKTFFRLGSGDQVAPLLETIRTRLLPAFEHLIDVTTSTFGPVFLDAVTQALLLFSKLSGTSGPLQVFTATLATALRLLNELIDTFPLLGSALVTIAAIGGISKALGVVSAITGVRTLLGLLRQARGVAATTAAAEGAAGAAGGLAGVTAGGGALGTVARLAQRFPRATGITAAAAAVLSLGAALDKLAGNRAIEALRKQIESYVRTRDLEGLRDLRHEFEQYDSFPGGIDKARKAIEQAEGAVSSISKATEGSVGEMRRSFHNLRRLVTADMDDIDSVVRRNMRRIRTRLGEDSQEGKDALAENFRRAANAVKRQMDSGEVSTKQGMRAIRGYLADELQLYGLSIRQARNIARTGDPDANRGREGGAFRAGGGWIGPRGAVGADTVPAMLAPGEAVLNRHQQAVIEGLLGDGFLDALFARVNRPHFMQRGGYPGVSGDTDFLPAVGRALSAMARAMHMPIFVQSGRRTLGEQNYQYRTKGPGRAAAPTPNAPHVRGVAADITPGQSVFGAVAGRFGLGFTVRGEPWHVQLLGAAASGAMGPAAARLARVLIQGGGLVGATAQRAVDVARGGAQRLLDRASMSSLAFAGEAAPTARGGFGKAQLRSLWTRAGGPGSMSNLMAAIALAESGGNPNAYNPSGATGLWQILGAILPGNLRDPMTNARNAVAKFRTQGLSAWEAYTNGSYRSFLSRGGRAVQFFQRGGRPSPNEITGGIGNVGGGGNAQGFTIRAARALQGPRIREYDDAMGRVDTLRKEYDLEERRYNRVDESELIDEQTGVMNRQAVAQKIKPLFQMVWLANEIEKGLRRARVIAQRVTRTYRRIVDALRASLRHAKRKDRAGIRQRLGTYRQDLGTWEANAEDRRFDFLNAHEDVIDITKEYQELFKLTDRPVEQEKPAGQDIADSLTGAGGPDAQAIVDQATERARVATHRAEIAEAAIRTGIFAGGIDPSKIGQAGYSWPQAVQNFTINTLHPGDSRTHDAIGRAATIGQGQQPARRSPRELLGV